MKMMTILDVPNNPVVPVKPESARVSLFPDSESKVIESNPFHASLGNVTRELFPRSRLIRPPKPTKAFSWKVKKEKLEIQYCSYTQQKRRNSSLLQTDFF